LTFLDQCRQRVAIEGLDLKQGEDLSMLSNVVGPDYFSTLRIRVVAGREFEDLDDDTSTAVAVVNNTLAERFWGGANAAIGKRINVADGGWRTVIGVAADVKYSRIDEEPRPYVYLPFLQSYRPDMLLHTRGTADVGQLVDQARAAIASLDADLPILDARSLADATRGALIFFRLMASMLFIFGVAGIALAAMGTYGLVSYTVTQSTREIGIRMALGASGGLVVRVFLARGLRLGAVGAALGLAASFGASHLLGSLLFGVSSTDLGSFGRAAAIVLAGVALATIIPAWRASRTDPLRALRHQ
jgi:hypothetical protein